MSFSVAVRAKGEEGESEKGLSKDPNIHYSTYYVCFTFLFVLFFSLCKAQA